MIHQYKNNGFNIVMDVNSGSVHVVDPVVYDAIEILAELAGDMADARPLSESEKAAVREKLSGAYECPEIDEALEDIQLLIDREELFTADLYKDYVLDFKKRKTVVKALCLHIAHDCNLALPLLLCGGGRVPRTQGSDELRGGKEGAGFPDCQFRQPQEPGGGLLRRRAADELGSGKAAGGIRPFQGGAEYNKQFRFTLTTNGVLLNDEIMEFCNREMGNVVLSLDGRQEVNDTMRPFRNGKGSYELIVPKFQKFADSRSAGQDYYVRGTFTRNNLDFSKDVMHFADLGFEQMSIEPVVAARRMSHTPSGRRIFRRSWRSTTSWQWSISSARKREGASTSSIS